MLLIRVSVYIRRGWDGDLRKMTLKQKIKKYMTVAVNNGELCAYSAKTFYVMEISDINDRRIANRK